MNLIDILFIPINKIKKTIGKTDDTGGSSSAGTVMGKLNNIINNSPSIIIGNTADTGGSSTTGTVMAKLNELISGTKRKVFKHFETYVAAGQTNATVISINGAGEFYGIFCNYITSLQVISDGVTFSDDTSVSKYPKGFKPGIARGIYNAGIGSDTSVEEANVFAATGTISIPFKNSLIVKITTSSSEKSSVSLSYSLYE